ncbi:MAG: hypothetical protein WCH01_19730 [Methylococcaceae bacterium]
MGVSMGFAAHLSRKIRLGPAVICQLRFQAKHRPKPVEERRLAVLYRRWHKLPGMEAGRITQHIEEQPVSQLPPPRKAIVTGLFLPVFRQLSVGYAIEVAVC